MPALVVAGALADAAQVGVTLAFEPPQAARAHPNHIDTIQTHGPLEFIPRMTETC
jgi:hypothetical protein